MMDKKERLNEIKALIEPFNNKYLSDELTDYVTNLCNKIGRKRTNSITRGKPEIWAASIVYVIARLNFLFDLENPNYLTPDIICDFFKTNKSTTGNKATQIEKDCNIRIGDEGLCNPHISDMFTFVQTPEGFILPKSYFAKDEILNEKEKQEREARLEKQRQQKLLEAEERKKRQAEMKRQKAEELRKKKHKNQGDLFSD